MRAKLLRRDELDWYQAIRDGQPAEHPFLGKGVAAYLEAARIALKPRGVQKWNAAIAATQGTTQAAYQQLLLETIPALEQTLLRLAAREDVTEDVKQFRTSPELQPIRLAIYELAALIAPEGGHKQ